MSGGGSQQSTTTTAPWEAQQPYLRAGFEQAYQLSKKPAQMYQGDLIAGKTDADTQAENYLSSYAGTLAGQSDQNLNALNWATGAGNLDVGNNQYVQGQMAANTNRLYQDFGDKTVPALRSNFGQAGQIGSSRQGIAEGLAAQGVSRAAADSNAQILGDAYGNALGAYSSALAQAPALMQAGVLPGTLLGTVGQSQRGFTQDQIDQDAARWDFQQNEEQARLNQFLSQVGGNFGGTTTSTIPGRSGSLLGGLAGGALTGLGATKGNPIGILGGALLGGLAGR